MADMTTANTYISFTDLNRSTVYMVQVQGATSKGDGPLSVLTSGQTLPGGKSYFNDLNFSSKMSADHLHVAVGF